jgi:hypothetical protein
MTRSAWPATVRVVHPSGPMGVKGSSRGAFELRTS